MEHLYDKLKRYEQSGIYPYHMPGHKRNMAGYPMELYYGIDITEIDWFDNLHNARGILKDMTERAAGLFGAETYMLVNGSTGGILSAVSAAVSGGGKILAARNCHKSLYHAIYVNRCEAEYIYPYFMEKYGLCGSVPAAEIEERLKTDSEIRAVFLTSPTYDGIVSDIEAIVGIAHGRNIPVIVDEAHGAHFILDERFPKSAVSLGADIVVHSIHKTLPAMTQTALLHVQGDLIDREKLERFLKIYQTSSPSYILMAGTEQCISILEKDGKALCGRFFALNDKFEEKIKNLRLLTVFPGKEESFGEKIFDADRGKKIISGRRPGLSGPELYRRFLEEYKLQMEMAGPDYVTAIMTIMDGEEGFARLAEALLDLDGRLGAPESGPRHEACGRAESGPWHEACGRSESGPRHGACGRSEDGSRYMGGEKQNISSHHTAGRQAARPKAACGIYEALERESGLCPLESCKGRISAEFIHIYPPGIPLIVPGEYFTNAVVEQLLQYRRQGFEIEGMYHNNKNVRVVGKEPYA